MKLRLTYLFILGFIFFKGYSHPVPASQPATASAVEHIQKPGDVHFSDYIEQEASTLSSLINDDNEEDDYEVFRKKEFLPTTHSIQHFTTADLLLHSFKNAQCLHRHFYHYSSDKYIFLKEFRI